MKRTIPLLSLAFFVGIALGYSFTYLNSFFGSVEYAPSFAQSEFVENCSKLNTAELTAQNIASLGGWCHIGGNYNACGDENVKRLKAGTDPFFEIHHKRDADNTWVCSIDATPENKITARAFYQYE